jgi:hypothetical protein
LRGVVARVGTQLGGEEPGRRGVRLAVDGQHLAQDAEHLVGQLTRVDEPGSGVGMGGPLQQPVERLESAEQLDLAPVRQRVLERALVAAEVDGERRQGAADREDVGRHRRAGLGDLRCLKAHRAVDRRLLVVDPHDTAEVDEFDLVAGLDDVVGLEVAEDQAPVVQVTERGHDLDQVCEGLRRRQRGGLVAVGLPAALEDGLEALAADVLHDDVTRTTVRHEIVDLDDVRVLDLGEEPLLRLCRGEGVGVTGVQQTLEDDPPVGDVLVDGQVDPAQAAMGQRADDLVLAADQVARLQFRREVELLPAVGAETRRAAGAFAAGPSDGIAALRAVPLLLGHLRDGHDRGRGVPLRQGSDVDEPATEAAPPAAGPGAAGSGGRTGPGGQGTGGGRVADG